MDDKSIIKLYFARNQLAISVTDEKYGPYCRSIASDILKNKEDSEECVNDTYMSAWNSIPPKKPDILSAFLGRITRNHAINKYKYNHAEKRGSGTFYEVLDELSDCVSGLDDVEDEVLSGEISKEINAFLKSLTERKRSIFVCRYWYADSISDIAKRFKMKDNAVAMVLFRLRKQLADYLKERGFDI